MVRLSVYLSITRQYCIDMTKSITKLFTPSGRYTILVFITRQHTDVRY